MNKSSAAVKAMQKLLALYCGQPVSIQQISEQGLSVSYLEQLFCYLKRGELVKSVRGPGGGYIPCNDNYTLGAVVRAVGAGGLLSRPDVLDALDNVPLITGGADGSCTQ